MQCLYLRSSSFNTYHSCELKYFLDYQVGYRSPPHNSKAEQGSIVHKALELLARKKLAMQNGESKFNDPELGDFTIDTTPEDFLNIAYKHSSKKTAHFYTWTDVEHVKCHVSLQRALEYNGGSYNPMNQNILAPETYFDFEIDKPWACFDYTMPDGEKIKGRLSIRGTMDLLVEGDKDTIIYGDYKTGARKDWGTGKPKTYESLRKDPQLRIYFLAIKKLFPQYKYVIMDVFFINDGGAISVDFDDSDIKLSESMLEKTFLKIKNNFRPKAHRSFHCNWCWYASHATADSSAGAATPKVEYKDSICQKTRQELLTLGYDRLYSKIYDREQGRSYGSGGGKSDETVKKL